jgi:AraC-like DNA-binding protein
MPGQDHELCSASDDFDLYVVGLSPDFSERVLGSRVASIQGGPQLTHLSSEQRATLFPLCQVEHCGTDTQAREHRVGEFWHKAHDCRATASKLHSITQRSLRLVQARPDLYRAELAEQTRVCPSEVSRYFRRDLGITLSAYRTRLRLMRFIQLVDAGCQSLLTASNQAGFGSYSQCHRVFQQTIGHSPRVYFSMQVRHSLETAYATDVQSQIWAKR